MSIARGLTKAASAAKAQSRGLVGKRNSQGDFMPEDVQMKGVQEAVTPDIQNYIDDVKSQIDEIDAKLDELSDMDTNVDIPGYKEEVKRLGNEKFALIEETLERLESEGIEPPAALIRMKGEMYNPKAYEGYN